MKFPDRVTERAAKIFPRQLSELIAKAIAKSEPGRITEHGFTKSDAIYFLTEQYLATHEFIRLHGLTDEYEKFWRTFLVEEREK